MSATATFSFIFFCLLINGLPSLASSDRNFTIDYTGDQFLKDGQPFRYISCNLHYFQIPFELWRDRMLRVRALGCNVLQTYILWNMHQPYDNATYNFDGDADVVTYLKTANQLGLLVVIRPGPFVNAEMDMGGLPYWLLKKKDAQLRTSKDEWYLEKIRVWLDYALANIVKPLLYNNGGPIILVQVENEYGGDPNCDAKYMAWLGDLFKLHLGNDTSLITTDPNGPQFLQCGHVQGALSTIDFGCLNKADVENSFTNLRKFLPKGPLVNSEFYPGWLDTWTDPKHNTTSTKACLDTMRHIWDLNVTSFNIYPAHGGTNWGYRAGGKYDNCYKGVTTGYDFDAPISEAGDTTSKFMEMRKVIEQLTGRTISDPIPASPVKHAYGQLRLAYLGTLFDLLPYLTPTDRVVHSEYPLTMEEMDQPYGFLLYQTNTTKSAGILKLTSVHDRAYVYINGQLTKVIQRKCDPTNSTLIKLSKFKSSNEMKIQILVENQGRIGYGDKIKDPKGVLENVTVDGEILTSWTMLPIDLSLISVISTGKIQNLIEIGRNRSAHDQNGAYLPSIYYGFFLANSSLGDTFFNPTGWGKGQLFINGRNIGRYWPQAGPQITLYLPQVYLKAGYDINFAYMFELDQPGNCDGDNGADSYACQASFTDKHIYI